MFGFLYSPEKTCNSETKSYYQSLFCGLSCQLRADYGVLARFLVNRDSTFLALVGDSITPNACSQKMMTCCNPLANKRGIMHGGQSLQYASAVSMCALAVKLEDNVSDDSGVKKYASLIGSKAISKAKDHAVSTLNSMHFPTQKVISQMESQTEVEASKPNFESAAAPTAQAFGTIMGHHAVAYQRLDLQSALTDLGHSLGRLVYWRDAIDDYEKDKKSGSFNPLTYLSPKVLGNLAKEELQRLKSTSEAISWTRNGDVIKSIVDHSISHHQDMAETDNKKKRVKKKKEKKSRDDSNSCCDCSSCSDCISCCDCFSCDFCSCD